MKTQLDKELILELQKKLNQIGYRCAENGTLTGNTVSAYNQYCRDNNKIAIDLSMITTIDLDSFTI